MTERIPLPSNKNIRVDLMQADEPIGEKTAELMDQGLHGTKALDLAGKEFREGPKIGVQQGLGLEVELPKPELVDTEAAWDQSHRPDGKRK